MAVKYVSTLASGTDDGTSPTHTTGTTGPWTLAQAIAATPAAGDEIRIMADGTYVRTASWTAAYANGSAAANIVITGANASGVVDGTRPTVQLSGSTLTALQVTGNHIRVDYLVLDGASQTASTGLYLNASYCRSRFCKILGCTAYGLRLAASVNSLFAVRCEVTGCSGTVGIFVGGNARALYCESWGNSTHGFQAEVNTFLEGCLAYANTGVNTDGFNGASVGYAARDCVAYGNGRAGFDLTGNAGFGSHLSGCLAWGNLGAGFRTDGVKAGAFLLNCAGGNNSAGNYNATDLPNVEGFIALTADPFTSAGTGNLAPNNAAGGGAAVRGPAFPWPRGTTTGYADIGVQHQDAGGGGGGAAAGLPLGRLVGGI